MPNFPIVDTHVHLWDSDLLNYEWLAELPLLNRPFLLPDFDEARGSVQVERLVFVEAAVAPAQALAEVEWVTQLAAVDGRIAGIVAQAPLEEGTAVSTHLETLAQNPLVKGVRRLLQSEPDPAFCLQPNFVRGVQLLPGYGLSFDICIYHQQLANVIELVEQCPAVDFVLDHIGKPDIKSQRFEPWRREIRQLAQLPNVVCKLSGLATEADHDNWQPVQLQPYIDHVIGCFGFDRVMYGGDWPVAKLATDYPRWVETLETAVSGCSEAELRKLFVENAVRVYRLD